MVIKPAPFFLTITFLGGMILLASVMSHYQRETTSIEEKYQYRSADEIDATYNDPLAKISNSAFYNDNVTPHSTGTIGLFLKDDQDHDGLSNDDEKTIHGTNPQNPDTDGDGTSDGIEILLGTDPLDKDSGGVDLPPVPVLPPPPIIQYDQLFINSLQKKVKNLGNPTEDWSLVTNAEFGENVSFKIDAELTNPSSTETFPATFSDQLGKNLQYISASGYIKIGQGTSQQLPDNWLAGYAVVISPEISMQKPVSVEITFQVLLVDNSADRYRITINRAWVKTLGDLQTASAFINITSLINE